MNLRKIISRFIPYYRSYISFSKTKQQSPYLKYLKFKIFGGKVYWPHDKNCIIANSKKIHVGINSFIGRSGCYFQGAGYIYIGNYVRIATNVGILSSNHDLYDHNKHHHKPIMIQDYCWIGMNSVILAGVELGTRTIVAAGAVVTKSFPEGFCVIGGNPAKIIKYLDKDKFKPWTYETEYYGYISKNEFEKIKREQYISLNISKEVGKN